MSFSQQLRNEANPIFQAIFAHPFVQGLGAGDVPKEAVAHYVKADSEYLHAFMNVYGTAISKCADREDIAFFKENIEFVLHSEIHPHHNLCAYIQTAYEDLQGFPLPPTADHYIKHMKTHAHEGTLGEILAVLLPCPWTYFEIGEYLMKEVKPTPDHPFYEWITFYADNSIRNTTQELRDRLDAWAEQAHPRDKKAMREAFIKSCQLEWAFWEMAYRQETWPTSAVKGVTPYA